MRYHSNDVKHEPMRRDWLRSPERRNRKEHRHKKQHNIDLRKNRRLKNR